MRLNLWHRLSIVGSLAWVIPSGTYFTILNAREIARASQIIEQVCGNRARSNLLGDNCVSDLRNTNATLREGYWLGPATLTLGPLMVAWICIAVVAACARWVIAGKSVSHVIVAGAEPTQS